MQIFEWSHHLETGLLEIDRQHRELLDTINRFGALLATDEVRQHDIEALLLQLVGYARLHFRDEEKLMGASPIDRRHVREHLHVHGSFVTHISSVLADRSSGNAVSDDALFDFLLNWLISHIAGMDMSMARQLAAIERGAGPSDAYESEEERESGSTGVLLTALKNLFEQVSLRNQKLQELNRTLERKVEERTRELTTSNSQLAELASTDALTGLPNRRHALEILRRLWLESNSDDRPLACMMIDADGFKQINDTYGHDAGDQVLRELAMELTHAMRTDDHVCRLGGDEFLIVCPGTDREGALHIAEVTRAWIADRVVPAGTGCWHGSISVGVAVQTEGMDRFEELLKAADRSVYAAKKAGRNCVRMLDADQDEPAAVTTRRR